MQVHWQEKALVLTPESEQERALLEVVEAAHRPMPRRTPPPETAMVSNQPLTGEAFSPQECS